VHHDELLREKDRLTPEAEELTAKRTQEASGIDSRATSLYAVLRERKAGVAVAQVERGMCQGCRITLPAAVLQKARGSTGLVQCVRCERILFVN
jgi:predicted  nucleic acid-binding Zn-ribbon protein